MRARVIRQIYNDRKTSASVLQRAVARRGRQRERALTVKLLALTVEGANCTSNRKADSMKNWAGNLEYASAEVRRPASVDELAGIVAGAGRVKALGSRHSFNRVGDTDGVHVLLDALPQRIELSPDHTTVRVSGGVSYGELCRALEQSGAAIHNLASLPHISVAGAVQTGTHGSGVNNQSLAGAVQSIDLVRPSGEQVSLTRADGDEFRASVVGLGALGIVTGLELAVQPSFRMRQRVLENLPWDQALGSFRELVSSAYSVSLFTDYAGGSISQVWLKALDSEPPPGRAVRCHCGREPAAPAAGHVRGKLHRAVGRTRPVAGPSSPLPPRVHAEQR